MPCATIAQPRVQVNSTIKQSMNYYQVHQIIRGVISLPCDGANPVMNANKKNGSGVYINFGVSFLPPAPTKKEKKIETKRVQYICICLLNKKDHLDASYYIPSHSFLSISCGS